MKLIINNCDIYDIGHDDSINEYILYVVTDDNKFVKGYCKIYGEKVLDGTVTNIKQQYDIKQTINVPYEKTTEEVLNELQN